MNEERRDPSRSPEDKAALDYLYLHPRSTQSRSVMKWHGRRYTVAHLVIFRLVAVGDAPLIVGVHAILDRDFDHGFSR